MGGAAKRLSVEARRTQLLELGLTLFANESYDSLSTERLARSAGVSKGLLFHYFGSKRGYYVATIHELARRVAIATAPADDLAFTETLRRSLQGYVEFVKNNGALYIAMVRGGVGVDEEVHSILQAVRLASVELVLDRAQIRRPSAKLRAALLGWVAFTEATTLAWLDQRGFSERDLIALLIETCFAQLAREGWRRDDETSTS